MRHRIADAGRAPTPSAPMPDPTPKDPADILGRASLAASESARQLAASDPGAMSHDTVNRALARFQPIVESLRHVKRDEFTAAWQQVAIKSLERMDALLDGEADALATVPQKGSIGGELRNYSVAAGIASEKALLFAGQPTAITATTHAHRLALPEEAAQLAGLASRLARLAGVEAGEIGPAGGAHEVVIATARDVTPDSGSTRS